LPEKDVTMKLHLGAGKVRIPGYINVDILPAAGIDIVTDIRSLPFKDASADFIYSCALIEHMGRAEWKHVLKHWYAKLRPGGRLRLSTADFEAACSRYLRTGNISELLGLVIGGQKDEYDRHGMIFDFELLSRGLEEAGFVKVHRYDWKDTELFTLEIDDYSQAYLPHMDKENGQLMMLNVEAEKPGHNGDDS
jgi:predicted SAM-dependent methyltransferase